MTLDPIHPETPFLRETFPAFGQSELIAWLLQQSQQNDFEPEIELMRVGGVVRHIPLVLRGSVKVSRVDAEGRDLFLYYNLPGENCAMTLKACYKGERSRINAVRRDARSCQRRSVHQADRQTHPSAPPGKHPVAKR